MNYRQSAPLPIEFRLAVACCRWAFAGGGADTVASCARDVDWRRFVAVAGRHRIEGLVWHSLNRLDVPLPEAVAERLSARARAIADHGLRAAAESARLLRSFEEAGIALLFIKGVTLGKLAYPHPFLKMSWDVDVLVALDDIAKTAALLDALGYATVAPDNPAKLVAWHRRRKESVWVNPDKRLHLELHGRLPLNPALIPSIGIASPHQNVEVAPGIVLPTLAADELFAYLCVHGALSGWHRLKWLSDLAALLDGLGEKEIARLHSASQALGAGRAAGQALLLAHMLFTTDIGEALERQLAKDPETRWLVGIALAQMIGRADLRDLADVRLGTVMIHWSHLLLAPGWTAKWRELRRKTGEILRHAVGTARGGITK